MALISRDQMKLCDAIEMAIGFFAIWDNSMFSIISFSEHMGNTNSV